MLERVSVQAIHMSLAEADWQRGRARHGRQGPRGYEWQWVWMGAPLSADLSAPRVRSLLFRRSCTAPTAWTAYRVYASRDTDLDTVVRVAGTRWGIESSFEAAKGEVGLDEYEVRSATGWYRHMTLALWAMALLAAVRAAPQSVTPTKKATVVLRQWRDDPTRVRQLCGWGWIQEALPARETMA